MKATSIYTTLFFLVLNLGSFSQTSTFEYSFSTSGNDFIYNIVECTNGDIYFCGGISEKIDIFNSSLLVGKINSNGELLDSINYSVENKSIYGVQLLPKETGEFVLFANLSDTLKFNPSICFYNLDTDLNLTNETVYNFNPNYLFFSSYSILLENGNVLSSVSLREYPLTNWKTTNYLLSPDFDSIIAVYYPSGSRSITHIKELADNNIWTLNLLLRKYEILNQDLEIINTKDIPKLFPGNISICWDTDSSFFMSGVYAPPSFPNGQNLQFIRQFHPVDTTGFLSNYWRYSDTVDMPAVYNGVDLNNKDSVFFGGTENIEFYNPWYGTQPSWFAIFQTDSLLNIRWERFYGGDAYYVMTNLIATNDGGCIVAGTRYDYLNAPENMLDIVILKLDNNGLITNMEETEESKFSEAIVYPNPGITEMNIKVAAQYNVSKFVLYDINGNLVLSKEIHGNNHTINTNHLRQGSYIYTITNNNGLNETGIWIKK